MVPISMTSSWCKKNTGHGDDDCDHKYDYHLVVALIVVEGDGDDDDGDYDYAPAAQMKGYDDDGGGVGYLLGKNSPRGLSPGIEVRDLILSIK